MRKTGLLIISLFFFTNLTIVDAQAAENCSSVRSSIKSKEVVGKSLYLKYKQSENAYIKYFAANISKGTTAAFNLGLTQKWLQSSQILIKSDIQLYSYAVKNLSCFSESRQVEIYSDYEDLKESLKILKSLIAQFEGFMPDDDRYPRYVSILTGRKKVCWDTFANICTWEN